MAEFEQLGAMLAPDQGIITMNPQKLIPLMPWSFIPPLLFFIRLLTSSPVFSQNSPLHLQAKPAKWLEAYNNRPLKMSLDSTSLIFSGASLRVPVGYRFTNASQGRFSIEKNSKLIVEGFFETMDDYYFGRARGVDSFDVFKGFAISRASDEFAVDTPTEGTYHADVEKVEDTLNPGGVRVLVIYHRFKKVDLDRYNFLAPFKQVIYCADLSFGTIIRQLMISSDTYPDNLVESHAVSDSLIKSLRYECPTDTTDR